MPAAYDKYNYPDYWKGRDYEHGSEVIAIREFLDQIPRIESIVDVGAGYGRHTTNYVYRAKKIVLSDPSAKLLSEAKSRLAQYKKIKYVQSKLQNLPAKLKNQKFDLAIFIRVIHHIQDPVEALDYVDKLIKPGGYLIIEFANKIHGKEIIKNFLKGNFTFPIDIFPEDKRSTNSINQNTIPFLNFHPDTIKELLNSKRYKLLDIRSVSNIRSTFLKRYLPISVLLSLESLLQNPLAFFKFGPSIFILARKPRVTG
jgi:ubiquinone/menaquinone biosynthesis C-methylase UbiE